ncbi:uncharacterized protein LOC141641974 [Silene latifolia]|uniref:uncharacterized protein LOC141641974 n=1 Tax=Silene latifolia TaxID=37657 RepID=UPI003D77361F
MNSSCGAIAGAPCVRHNNIAFFKPTTTTSSSSSSCCIRFNSNVFITQSSLQYQSTQHKHSYDNTTTPKPSFRDQDTTTPDDADADAAAAADPELRTVLQLATNSELFELHSILFRPSYFSPLLKSVTNGLQIDRFMIEEDFEERDQFINALESRFLYLAADARSTLRGWRPSYRNVLLDVRKELKIPCSTRLSVEDLEVEIFIFMIQECSRDWDTADAVRVGAAELCSLLLKGGQLVSLMKISQLVSTKLSEKMLVEAAKHKFGSEVIKKGLTGATSRYLGMSSLASLFGPMLWGTFLADVVIQMLGTDYIRILQAIYAFAQIRILRRHGLHLDKLGTGF